MAKKPITTTTKSNPSNNSSCPNVYRSTLVIWSKPITDNIKPMTVAINPFVKFVPVRLDSVEKAKMIKAKYSAGPKRMAH